jgi:hypothetical protein
MNIFSRPKKRVFLKTLFLDKFFNIGKYFYLFDKKNLLNLFRIMFFFIVLEISLKKLIEFLNKINSEVEHIGLSN